MNITKYFFTTLTTLSLTLALGACTTTSTYQPNYIEADPELIKDIDQVKERYVDNDEVLVSALTALPTKNGEADALLLALEKLEASLGSTNASAMAQEVVEESRFASYELRDEWRYRVVLASLLSDASYNKTAVTSNDIAHIEKSCAPKTPAQYKPNVAAYERLLSQACFDYAKGNKVSLAEKKALLATFLTSSMPKTTQQKIIGFLKTHSGPNNYLNSIIGNL